LINQIYFFQHQICNQGLQKNKDSNKVHHSNNVNPAYHWQTFLKKQTKETKWQVQHKLKKQVQTKDGIDLSNWPEVQWSISVVTTKGICLSILLPVTPMSVQSYEKNMCILFVKTKHAHFGLSINKPTV
jgi:hypothetical protein